MDKVKNQAVVALGKTGGKKRAACEAPEQRTESVCHGGNTRQAKAHKEDKYGEKYGET
jgi:hypothetical protein